MRGRVCQLEYKTSMIFWSETVGLNQGSPKRLILTPWGGEKGLIRLFKGLINVLLFNYHLLSCTCVGVDGFKSLGALGLNAKS